MLEDSDIECPKCGNRGAFVKNVTDIAPSIHYVHDVADYICKSCDHGWQGDYGYKGLA